MLQRIMLLLLLGFNGSLLAQTSILILGDSLSAGYGLKQEQAWVQLLQTTYNQQKDDIKLINASISGETTGGALERLPPLLTKYQPDLVLIELGANDALRGYPIKLIKQNLNRIITLNKASGAETVLMQIEITPNLGKRYATMFKNSFKTVAEQQNVAMIPFFLLDVAAKPELMQGDQLHPNAKAQPLIRDTMQQALAPHIRKVTTN